MPEQESQETILSSLEQINISISKLNEIINKTEDIVSYKIPISTLDTLNEVVQSLPETGKDGITYLIETGKDTGIYNRYIWENNRFINLGITEYPLVSSSVNGLMSSLDKEKLDSISTGAEVNSVTGIKGNLESSYRVGNVNLTPANIGAAESNHSHGNITNSGAIGTTANLPIITDTNGVLKTGSFGNSENTFCQGNDSRLSDSRTPTSHTHSASDINSGILNTNRIPNLDASKITSGTIDIARLPAAALERLVTVTDAAERKSLTTSSVQVGDTVKEISTGKMYRVTDDTKLNSDDGYTEYSVGSAASVPWSGITGKPSTYYTHPTTSGNKHIPSGGSSGQFLGWSSDGTAKWVNNPNTNTDTLVTQTVSTDNSELPLLAKASAGITTVTDTSKFSSAVKLNPSTGTITATNLSVGNLHYIGDRNFTIGTVDNASDSYLQINSIVDSKSVTIANQGTNNITFTTKGNITATGTVTASSFSGPLTGNATTATSSTSSTYLTPLAANTMKVDGENLAQNKLFVEEVYNTGYPIRYGNVISVQGAAHNGSGQLLLGWSGASNAVESLYYRNKRDTTDAHWSEWRKIAYTTDNVASATKAIQDGNGNVITETYMLKDGNQDMVGEKTFHDRMNFIADNSTASNGEGEQLMVFAGTQLEKGTLPTTQAWTSIVFTDKTYATNATNTNRFAGFGANVATNGKTQIGFYACDWSTPNQHKSNGIYIHYPYGGTPYTACITPPNNNNSTQIATTAWVNNNARKPLTAATTIYVSMTGTGDGTTAAKAMSLADLKRYLAVAHITSGTDLNGSYTLTICFVPGTAYGNATFDSNKMPGVRNLVLTTSTGTSSTTSNYTTNAPTFTNLYVNGPLAVTVRNLQVTGTIGAYYGGKLTIDTYLGVGRIQATNYGRVDIGNGTLNVHNCTTDYLFYAVEYGMIVINTATTTVNFRERAYFTQAIFGAVAKGRLYINYGRMKYTGTQPRVVLAASGTLTGASSTASATAEKVVTLSSGQTFTLANNAVAYVKFNNINTAANPTLNINGTGAKPIYFGSSAIPAEYLCANVQYKFTYNGTNFVCNNGFNRLTNITDNSLLNTASNYNSTYNSGEWNWTGFSNNWVSCSVCNGALFGNLGTSRAIDGVNFNGGGAIIHYGTCSTAAATAAKTVACTSFVLTTGSRITVKFTVTNTAANPTLNVNSTGGKAIQYRGAAITAGYLAANRTYEFVYDGSSYQLVGDIDTNSASSDERIKNSIASIDDNVLDIWGSVNWVQFRYNDSTEEKGENAPLHTGLIAQQVKGVYQDKSIDISKYDLLLYDEWEVTNEDNGSIETDNMYGIRYTEALCMEAAYQRRRADRLEAKVTDLENRLLALEVGRKEE